MTSQDLHQRQRRAEREAAFRRLSDTADEIDLLDYLISYTAGESTLSQGARFPNGVDLHLPSAGLQSLLHRWAADIHEAGDVLDGGEA